MQAERERERERESERERERVCVCIRKQALHTCVKSYRQVDMPTNK